MFLYSSIMLIAVPGGPHPHGGGGQLGGGGSGCGEDVCGGSWEVLLGTAGVVSYLATSGAPWSPTDCGCFDPTTQPTFSHGGPDDPGT